MYQLLGIYDERKGFSFLPTQIGEKEPLEKGIRLYFARVQKIPVTENQAREQLLQRLAAHPLDWLKPDRKYWTIDLNALVSQLPETKRLDCPTWLKGVILIEPTFDPGYPTDLDKPRQALWRGFICFDITRETIRKRPGSGLAPVQIDSSLEAFTNDYPNPAVTAFVIMRFGETPGHKKITQAIERALRPFGIIALRADHKEYAPEIYSNILTYMHGCNFGIAVFERLESEDFNPNVAFEVGYMLAMSKPVCFLRDRTLGSMPTDLLGKLYRPFDAQRPTSSIPPVLQKWCRDLGFAPPESQIAKTVDAN